MDQGLEQFLRNLIHKAHQPAELPDVLLHKMVQDLFIQIEQRLEDVVLEHLPEQHHIEYFTLLRTGGTQQDIMELVQSHVPDIHDKARAAIQEFENDYLLWTAKVA